MYIPQPNEYYDKLIAIAFDMLNIPLSESPALYHKRCAREMKHIKNSYRKNGKIKFQSYFVSKNMDSIKIAKYFIIYYLWQSNIKNPFSASYRGASINYISDILCNDNFYKTLYERFKNQSDSIKRVPVLRRCITEISFQIQ